MAPVEEKEEDKSFRAKRPQREGQVVSSAEAEVVEVEIMKAVAAAGQVAQVGQVLR